MYDWLNEALTDDEAQVVTANRRLARTLGVAYGERQIASGILAWRSPLIFAWRDWQSALLDSVDVDDTLPARISDYQARVLWERCLKDVIDDPFLNYGNLARQCRDTWQRLHEWCVPLKHAEDAARGPDQGLFVRAASQYEEYLHARQWVDNATLPNLLIQFAQQGLLKAPRQVTLAGFDRLSPQVEDLCAALKSKGTRIVRHQAARRGVAELRRFESPDAELRAAGAWARAQLSEDSSQQIAIVVGQLEQNAERSGALLREGFSPGWQYAPPRIAAALNVSYGARLADYPAVSIALLALRWLYSDLRSADISLLLRSPYLGMTPTTGRSLLELKLRELPDQFWTPEQLVFALQRRELAAEAEDWLARFGRLRDSLSAAANRMQPSRWAELLDTVLRTLNWPGDTPLGSADFQLDNRWRDLLNEFSRLELVSPQMGGAEAVARLASMAAEALFQPESEGAAVSVLGPLEAAGLEFDKVWMTGLTAEEWPASSRPLPLLARELQVTHDMPDATPDETARFARRVFDRVRSSASQCVISYPSTIGDAEQVPSALVDDLRVSERDCTRDGDPGWHAMSLRERMSVVEASDRVPAVAPDEQLTGGAGTIQRQSSEPFSAFAFGRLGVRSIAPFTTGIAANVRGNLVHDALFHLYTGKPSQRDLLSWTEAERETRIKKALRQAFQRYERHADALLFNLLALEEARTAQLLRRVLQIDAERPPFTVASVEASTQARVGDIQLHLRCDRIDRAADGSLIILDYKTGVKKKFLTRDMPREWQLVVYATLPQEAVGALALFNVDSRETFIDGAGPALQETQDWDVRLQEWKAAVLDLATQIARGDVRLNGRLSSRDAAPLALLSRIAELDRDN